MTEFHQFINKGSQYSYINAFTIILVTLFLIILLVIPNLGLPAFLGQIESSYTLGMNYPGYIAHPYIDSINNMVLLSFKIINWITIAMLLLDLLLCVNYFAGNGFQGLYRLRNAISMVFALQWLIIGFSIIMVGFTTDNTNGAIIFEVIFGLFGILFICSIIEELFQATLNLKPLYGIIKARKKSEKEKLHGGE